MNPNATRICRVYTAGILLLLQLLLSAANARAQKLITPGYQFNSDPTCREWNGRFYLFTTHDPFTVQFETDNTKFKGMCDFHAKAPAALANVRSNEPEDCPQVKPFEPYCLRHTALTNLAAGCRDTFALAKIAGHSSIHQTMRYVHPRQTPSSKRSRKWAISKK